MDPNGFQVEVRAPADDAVEGRPALVATNVGIAGLETLVEWMSFVGGDASATPGAAAKPAWGAWLDGCGSLLTLRDNIFRSGRANAGISGASGLPGAMQTTSAQTGADPRVAIEDVGDNCIIGAQNTVSGGSGGMNLCDGTDVSGGDGGSPGCPLFANFQPSGQSGSGVLGGAGGAGGQDSQGPITGSSCSQAVCCGLADFSVPTNFQGPQSGSAGGDGSHGDGGMGCDQPWGSFDSMMRWLPDTSTNGSSGTAGSGGGGGGAGGGTELAVFAGMCEFADGLGGGGGGGGAGGCGGKAGFAGTSGAPSVALVLINAISLPAIQNNMFFSGPGGDGGDGGSGGDGGLGGQGAFGGEIPRADRSTPPLAGAFPGGRGGRGGTGGSGGGGGGGCGGASTGIWITSGGSATWVSTLEAGNTYSLGPAGRPGRGGPGAAPGQDGQSGGAHSVRLE